MTSANEYQPCAKRQQLTVFNRDGSRGKVQRCTERTAEAYGTDVGPEACAACPVRVAITKIAMRKREYKPPLFHEIAKVVSTEKDTSPSKKWLPCADRNIVRAASCCGQTSTHRVCNSVDCFRMGAEVTPVICSECPHRRA